MMGQTAYWEHEKYRIKKKHVDEETGEKENIENIEKFKKKKVIQSETNQKFSWKDSGLFNITEKFVESLNLSELFRLSELQLEL